MYQAGFVGSVQSVFVGIGLEFIKKSYLTKEVDQFTTYMQSTQKSPLNNGYNVEIST